GPVTAGQTEPGDAAHHDRHGGTGVGLLELLGAAHRPADRVDAGRDRQPAAHHRSRQAGSRERHRRRPAPQGRGVHVAARRDAPPRAREKRGAGADRRHLDQGKNPGRDDRAPRTPGRGGGLALRHLQVPPRDHRALRPVGRVSVRHREPEPHHRARGREPQAGAAAGHALPGRYTGCAARGAVLDPHLREGGGSAARAREEAGGAAGGGAGGRGTRVRARSAVVLAALVAVGPLASQAKPKPVAKPDSAKADAAKANSTAAPVLVREVYSYEGGGRDPFLSLLKSGDIRPLLSDLKLVGIYYDGRFTARSVAVLRDVTNNKIYRVKPGDIIGRLKVTSIRPREIVFTVQEFGFERQEGLQLAKQEVTP